MAEVEERQVGYVSKSYGIVRERVCADGGVCRAEVLSGLSTTATPPPICNPVELPGQMQRAFLLLLFF